jgi:hypothetical protein
MHALRAPNQKRDLDLARDSISPAASKARATAQGEGKKDRFYKPLSQEFRRDGFNYRQIAREGDFAIYRQTWKGYEDSAVFELIRNKRRQGFEIGGRWIPPAEVYPNSEACGVDGFTVTDKEAALHKLREIK